MCVFQYCIATPLTFEFVSIVDSTIENSCVVPTDQKVSHCSHGLTPGTVMVLGMGDLGQLGLGESILERKKPYPVGGILEGKNIIQVVCGGVHTVALTKEGQVS